MADYPAAKEGAAQIIEDVRAVADRIINSAPPSSEGGRPVDIGVYARPEEEIAAELRNKA